jgi:hypothetical protein
MPLSLVGDVTDAVERFGKTPNRVSSCCAAITRAPAATGDGVPPPDAFGAQSACAHRDSGAGQRLQSLAMPAHPRQRFPVQVTAALPIARRAQRAPRDDRRARPVCQSAGRETMQQYFASTASPCRSSTIGARASPARRRWRS